MAEKNIFDVMSILSRNADKNFVQRVMFPEQAPSITNYDNAGRVTGHSTHSMAADVDDVGNWFVYPTVVQQSDGSLKRLQQTRDNPEAFKHAAQTGERIPFGKDKDSAIWFSSDDGYKQIWRGQ